MASFSAVVGDWCRKVPEAYDVIFRESAQELVEQLNTLVPVATGFLRASLVASISAMPMIRAADGQVPGDLGEIVLVIAGLEAGDTLYLGYTASYGPYVAFGANGRPGRPWVDMAAQRWPSIVNEVAARVKQRLGL